MQELSRRLEDLKDQGLYRRLGLVSGPQGPRVVLDGTPVLMLCSDNFLGLADHPRVREAAADAAMRWGVGAASSRLTAGSMTIHGRLEARIAEFIGEEAALLFGSGSQAAAGTIQALRAVTSMIAIDSRSHPALIDACRATGLPLVPFTGSADSLAPRLHEAGASGTVGSPLIVTDSVFAADGARADLRGLAAIASHLGARTLVNESYALGCVGPGGRGAIAAEGLPGVFDVVTGSLGKALGAHGGFVSGDATLVRYLVNTARPLAHCTAPSPPVIAGALAALELLEAQPERAERLRANAVVLHAALRDEGLAVAEPPSHILPIVTGSRDTATALAEQLLERRVFVEALTAPATPEARSGIRVTVSAAHTPQELRRAATAIADCARDLGLAIAAGPVTPSITQADDSFGEWSSAPAQAPRAHVATHDAPQPGGIFDVEQIDPSLLRASRGRTLAGRLRD